MENNLADYTPFGEEWENEVMKHSKPVITEMFRKVCLELLGLKSEHEATKQALSKLQSDLLNNYVEKSEVDFEKYNEICAKEEAYKKQLAELKAENEKLSANGMKLGYFIFKDACGEQVRKEVYDNYTGFKQVLPIGLDRIIDIARTEERARIRIWLNKAIADAKQEKGWEEHSVDIARHEGMIFAYENCRSAIIAD